MDNRSRMDGFTDLQDELSGNQSPEGEQESSIFDDNTGEFKRTGFSSSYRDDSRSISDDYEKMLKEQEEFLKTLDEQFGTFTTDETPADNIPTLEELLESFVMPHQPQEEPAEEEQPVFNTEKEPEIIETEIQPEETVVQSEEEPLESFAPEAIVDRPEETVIGDLGDTIEIRPIDTHDDEVEDILEGIDINDLPEQETYQELIVEEPQYEEPEIPQFDQQEQPQEPETEIYFEDPGYFNPPFESAEEQPEEEPAAEEQFEEVHFAAPEQEEEYDDDDDDYDVEEAIKNAFASMGFEEEEYEEQPEEPEIPQFEQAEEEPAAEEQPEWEEPYFDLNPVEQPYVREENAMPKISSVFGPTDGLVNEGYHTVEDYLQSEADKESDEEEEGEIFVADNSQYAGDNPFSVEEYETAPYEEEYNPLFDELLGEEPVDELNQEPADSFTENNVDEFVEEAAEEIEAEPNTTENEEIANDDPSQLVQKSNFTNKPKITSETSQINETETKYEYIR